MCSSPRRKGLSSVHHIHLAQMCFDTISLLGPVACYASRSVSPNCSIWEKKICSDDVMVLYTLGVFFFSEVDV